MPGGVQKYPQQVSLFTEKMPHRKLPYAVHIICSSYILMIHIDVCNGVQTFKAQQNAVTCQKIRFTGKYRLIFIVIFHQRQGLVLIVFPKGSSILPFLNRSVYTVPGTCACCRSFCPAVCISQFLFRFCFIIQLLSPFSFLTVPYTHGSLRSLILHFRRSEDGYIPGALQTSPPHKNMWEGLFCRSHPDILLLPA